MDPDLPGRDYLVRPPYHLRISWALHPILESALAPEKGIQGRDLKSPVARQSPERLLEDLEFRAGTGSGQGSFGSQCETIGGDVVDRLKGVGAGFRDVSERVIAKGLREGGAAVHGGKTDKVVVRIAAILCVGAAERVGDVL